MSVTSIPRTVVRPVVVVSRRRVGLLAVAAALAATIVGLLVVGPGHTPTPTLSPTESPGSATTAATAAIVAPSSAPTSTPFEATGLLAVYQVNGSNADVFTFDPTTNARRDVATLGLDNLAQRAGTWARVKWLSDRHTIAIFTTGDSANALPGEQVDAQTGNVTSPQALIETLSPDGAFGARRDGDVGIFGWQGAVVRHLAVPGGLLQDLGPWSPDGGSIAVAGCQPCNILGKGPDATNRAHVYVLPVDGSQFRVLGDQLTDKNFTWLAWSPDGATIAAGLGGIVLIDVATGHMIRLTSNVNDIEMAWSNDGSRIAFTRSFGTGLGIWVIGADGKGLTRLTSAPAQSGDHTSGDQVPVWSPDGATILFNRGDGQAFGDLWQVPSNGGSTGLLLPSAIADW